MNIHFTGRNLDITDALKNSTTEKMQRLSKRHPNVKDVELILHVENITHIAEANIHLKGSDFHATAKDTDMYVAIDDLINKLDVLLTKHKEKMSGHH
jgi:putative sigma-54 modulation protein